MKQRSRLFLIVAALVLLLSGCRTTKYVPVKETHTDTLYKARKDSVKWIEKIHYVDKEKSKDSTATTLDAKGNITRTDTWHWRDRTSSNSDSLLYYKSKLDSALQSKADSVPQPYPVYKNKYVEKKLLGWQNFIMKMICRTIGHYPCPGLWGCESMEEIQCDRPPIPNNKTHKIES